MFFYIYSFHQLNSHQYHIWFITFTLTITKIANKSFITVLLSFDSLYSQMHLSSFHLCLLLQTAASSLHLHLHVSCHCMCLASLVLEIRFNALTFRFLTTSGTHNFAYESLILLQVALHLLLLMLKGKNTGSSLLPLTICGFTLHYWLFNEIHFNGFTLYKVDENANPVKNSFLMSCNILYYVLRFHQILVNV